MNVCFLINGKTSEIEAELVQDEKIIIKSDWILNHIVSNKGIYLDEKFKKSYGIADSRLLLPTTQDARCEALFAKAFKECLFEDGLKQMGYYWRVKNNYDDMSAEQLENEIHKKRLT